MLLRPSLKSLEDRLGDPEARLYLSPFAVAAGDVARVRLEVENPYCIFTGAITAQVCFLYFFQIHLLTFYSFSFLYLVHLLEDKNRDRRVTTRLWHKPHQIHRCYPIPVARG